MYHSALLHHTLHTMQGEDFGSLTRCSHEPGDVRLEWSNRSNSSMGFGVAPTTIHCPSRGVGSGGTISLLCLALYAIMLIELCFNVMSLFTYLSLMWSITFFLSRL
jgi:hypothetical protein